MNIVDVRVARLSASLAVEILYNNLRIQQAPTVRLLGQTGFSLNLNLNMTVTLF